jgi:exodeoxyribonuclease VII large subunit
MACAGRARCRGLGIKIEEGMEVIATGKITTYAGSSRYQIIIDRLELAGEGALLKLPRGPAQEARGRGPVRQARKRPLPFLPEVIGVVTSPSGAVIRDILHRLADRFPCACWSGRWRCRATRRPARWRRRSPASTACPRRARCRGPQVLIVARGGGSLEDLWAFNEEIVVRAAAARPSR